MKKQKGFTLIELLVVIAIIGLLSTLAMVSLNNARQKAQDARRMSDLKQLSTAMELYYSENGTYPAGGVCDAAGVVALAAGGPICGTGNRIVDATPTVFLNSLPEDPASGVTYRYGTGSDTTTYCFSADLITDDPGAFFSCSAGSCFPTAAACP